MTSPGGSRRDDDDVHPTGGEPMRTLHLGLRVADLDRSLAFYGASDPHRGNGLSHFVITVGSRAGTVAELAARGIDVDASSSPDGSDDFLTTWISDPDGNRIELVQWPAGHPDGITAADGPG
jgi:lactoylglutathione lyase